MAPSHTNELKIPEKVLTLCSKSGPIEKRLFRSMIRQLIWEIRVKWFSSGKGTGTLASRVEMGNLGSYVG